MRFQPPTALTVNLDRLGIFLSATCLLHCLSIPVLLTLAPIAQSSLLDEHTFHVILLWFIVPTSLIALGIGCRDHRDPIILLLGAVGLTLLVCVAVVGHTYISESTERVLTMLAGLLLAAAHIRNFRVCRAMRCDHEAGERH
jgi:hypothetical protein